MKWDCGNRRRAPGDRKRSGPALRPARILSTFPAVRLPTLLLLLVLLVPLLEACAPFPRHPPPSRCWVQLFEKAGFAPDCRHDILFGPGRWSSLKYLPNSQRLDWNGAIASLISGPEAAVILWSETEFGGKRVRFEPDTLLADREELPLRSVGSVAIECVEDP